ncbi:G-type lectin S-receptor-like serine/threonine-protein kinase At4g27290 [Brassica napus]|uniref:G-type lectin S-receptor-like serine/threonine-protein kinase At4g27290 n=1 Tax=Brassica oleracea var. oleracea TaxID=109376 RepID=UPI0006A6E1F8|nr:PREDICTED: G-type lectin S-receptor-like serine/threonine-protein kinase At4g27290 [Brassica oleracea var. oleracea]XP_013705446.2 G-type lectin S-receptor-like serine/threonine-protein kinase At4g27290 [Brassica napus]
MEAINVLHLLLISQFFAFLFAQATDIITPNQTLKDGDTIVSKDGSFELGFFSPGGSRNRYLGIWYKKVSLQTVVWVANRDSPLYDLSGALKVNGNGSLCLFSGMNSLIWSSFSLKKIDARYPIVQILDTGNLVVRSSGDDQDYIWQSLDYPGDTFLPGMKYGIDFLTGFNRFLTSWKSPDDPSTGNYTNKLDPNGVPQFFLKRNSVDVFRAGPWNGLRFTGMPNLKPNPIYRYEFVLTEDEAYYTYRLENPSVITRMQLNPSGALQRYTWVDSHWNFYLSAEMDSCDLYKLCGSYGSCNINDSPACRCLKGFVPYSPKAYSDGDWSKGCVRRVKLSCGEGEEDFLKISKLKLPDTRASWYDKSMDLNECKRECLRNCSCSAYSPFDIRDGGRGCIIWFGDLLDIREYDENGQDLFVRLATSEIDTLQRDLDRVSSRRQEEEDPELPFLDLEVISEATCGFSDENKLGQGGFGPVYKGTLSTGEEIAVKRLSRTSRQGIEEFKNEIKLIAKLQHRNLVKILGYCVEEDERMLIYEYQRNKSLDSFIFDKERRKELDWPKRLEIIKGIARGLMYLHQDSRLRIIHRDLKASNVLLDSDMNPKISDFGLARTLGGDETEANTTRVVGTYGYMSPEYQIDGYFSLKSDVFSFGVLVLEIVSGRRNHGFCNHEHRLNLLGHAWRQYREEKASELIDEAFKESCTDISEVLRAIHIGLLCVQQDPIDRPNMSMVVLMLSSEMLLLDPKEPGFYNERNLLFSDTTSINIDVPSNNLQTMSVMEPR